MNQMTTSLSPGEINLSLIPTDWPLTPVGKDKAPYVTGWQKKPFDISEINNEIETGGCCAVGLISGPVYNQPYGLVWVDIDGPTVYDTIKDVSGLAVEAALPKTLTICSGREGRERKLYRVLKNNWHHFVRNKYAWHAEGNGEKLEVLWQRHQGVLMGAHPKTEGYFTKENEDFAFATDLPELPQWILDSIAAKNKQQGKPSESSARIFGESFAINAHIGHDHEMKEAVRALWSLPESHVENYDQWLTAGQALHFIDETLLDAWEEWSKQGSTYQPGVCQQKWHSFTKDGGITAGSLFAAAKENGFKFSQEHTTMAAPEDAMNALDNLLHELLGDEVPDEAVVNNTPPEKFSTDLKKKSRKNEPNSRVCEILLAMFKGNIVFDRTNNCYYQYEHKAPGMWSALSEFDMKRVLKENLDRMGSEILPNGYGMALINDLYTMLSLEVPMANEWDANKNLILFLNGVYDVENHEISGFKREEYISRNLPYEYDPGADCEPIIAWLKYTQHDDWNRVQLLRAWMRAVLVGGSNIQKFVEIVGPGKSGKSSFTALCHALVGFEGAAISNLERIEKNRFEMAKLFGKRLCLFNDIDRYGGAVANLKALTGADVVTNEHKFKQEETIFKFDGLIMMTANEQIQTTDPTSGLARRRITIPFDRPFTGNSEEQCVLIDCSPNGVTGKFAKYIPGLINWLVQMPEKDMRAYLMETNEKVPFMNQYAMQQQRQSNPLMDWMAECVIFDPSIMTYVGSAKLAPKDSTRKYAYAEHKLYANYREFCDENGTNSMSRARFKNAIKDIFTNQLKLHIYKDNNRTARFFNVNLRGRPDQNGRIDASKAAHYPSVLELAINPDQYRDFYGNAVITLKDYQQSKQEIV